VTTITPQQAADALKGFDAWAQAEIDGWQVPGMAVAVLVNGEIVHLAGYGWRDVDKKLPVTPDTLFAIGSCSKAFTTFTMGLLVDEGKLSWDKPVRHYLPAFKLYDPVASELATPRDLACHRTGLPRHDFMWYGSPFSRQELFERLPFIQPSHTFRNIYQYSNLMFMTAGYLVGQIAGMRWEDFAKQRIFDRLGMARSNFSVEDSKKDENAAQPYAVREGKACLIPFRNLDSMAPAGAINSSVNEMLTWLKLHLNGGKHNGEQLITPATLKLMHTTQMPVPITPDLPWGDYTEVEHVGYGLGWRTQTYCGHTMIGHMGGVDGFISSVSFLPNESIAVVILTNSGENFPATVVNFQITDRLLGLDPLPWSERLHTFNGKLKDMNAKPKTDALASRKTGTQPSHPIEEYTGEYEHPAYGILSVRCDGSALSILYNGLTLTLQHHHYDLFQVEIADEDYFALATFFTDGAGAIQRVSIPIEPTVEPIVFQRISRDNGQ
jgi:CubicO group peptidase (beta-lactamase class C family)